MSTPMKYRRGISDGIHTFRLTEFSEQMGGSGHPYWRYNMVCVDKEDKDQSVTLFVSLSPAARFKQEEFLDAVGAPDEGQGYGEAFEGKLVRAEISHDKYKDDKGVEQVRPTVKRLIAAGAKVKSSAQQENITEVEVEIEDDEETKPVEDIVVIEDDDEIPF